MRQGGYNWPEAAMSILFEIALIIFLIWFCVSLIIVQRERNQVLKEISNKLDIPNYFKKEE